VRRCVLFVVGRAFFAVAPRAADFLAVVDRDAVVFVRAVVFLREAFFAVFAEAALRGARAAVLSFARVAFFTVFRFVAFAAVLLLRLLGLIARLRLAEPRVMHDFRELSLYEPMLYLS